nr:amidase family protein [Bradyrhizobium tropiciagri]
MAKTATPKGGCKVVTESAVHGVTANPYDLSKRPGGSSGRQLRFRLALVPSPLAVMAQDRSAFPRAAPTCSVLNRVSDELPNCRAWADRCRWAGR